MAKIFIPGNAPSYQILSTDINSGSKVDGVSYVGASVIATDTGKTYRVLDDQTLIEFSLPISGNISISGSDIQIGAVELKDGTSDTRAKITSGSAIVSTDKSLAVGVTNFPSTQIVSFGNLSVDTNFSGQIAISGSGIVVQGNTVSNNNGFLIKSHPDYTPTIWVFSYSGSSGSGFPLSSTIGFSFSGSVLSDLGFETTTGSATVCWIKQ